VAEQPPIAVKVVATAKTEEDLAAERQDREWRSSIERRLLILAAVIAAVGLLQFIAFGVQAIYLWLALRAMQRSAVLAERNMAIAQRAFVYVGTLTWSVDGQNVRIMPTWDNSGATPTRSLRISTNWKAWHGDPPADFAFSYARAPERLFLGPGAKSDVGSVLIPMRDIQAAIEARVHLYFWGRATYEDVFEGTEPHFVEFCYRLDVTGATPGNIALAFTHYGTHNRTDEDSQRL
jgi:hypothetical protein